MTRDTLTREQIIQATIKLLDEEELEGLSMRELGKRLGSAATAVYWHVGSKRKSHRPRRRPRGADLLPDLAVEDWKSAAVSMATGLHDMLVRHLWLVRAFGSHMVYGPGKARHDNHCFAIYEAAGLPEETVNRRQTSVFISYSAPLSVVQQRLRSNGNSTKRMRTHAKICAIGWPKLVRSRRPFRGCKLA